MVSSFGQDEVRIKITTDDQTRRGTESAKRNIGGLDSSLKSMKTNWLAVSAAAGVATLAIGGAGKAIGHLAGLASDLVESQNRVTQVFGSAAKSVNEFAESAATALGETENNALAAAGGFGSMFKAAGIAQAQAGEMSITMVQLAADLGSFNNIGTDEALTRLTQGLSGSTESLRTLGVFLSEANVANQALAMGLKSTKAELTDADKIQARYALTLAQTSDQQGDFARTSDGLANSTKILSAKFTELKTDLGSLLIPSMDVAVTAATKLVDALEDLANIGVINTVINLVVNRSDGEGFGGIGDERNPLNQFAGFVVDDVIAGTITGVATLLSGRAADSQDLITEFFKDRAKDAAGQIGTFDEGGSRFRAAPGFGVPGAGVNRDLRQGDPSLFGLDAGENQKLIAERDRARAATGALSEAESFLSSQRERIAAENTSSIVAAYLDGGLEAVSAVRQEQAELETAWQQVAEDLRNNLGIAVPEQFRDMWEQINDAQQEGVKAAIEAEEALARSRMDQAVANMIQIQNANMSAGVPLTPEQIAFLNDPSNFDFGVTPAVASTMPTNATPTINVKVMLGDKEVADVVAEANTFLAETGQ
tara:strand:+ start:448 stop:2232 length:1785 start_codon:yes stop_codon:yes gene_type:complete